MAASATIEAMVEIASPLYQSPQTEAVVSHHVSLLMPPSVEVVVVVVQVVDHEVVQQIPETEY